MHASMERAVPKHEDRDLYKIGFIMEQALGHVTYTKNLQKNVAGDASIEAYWMPIPFEVRGFAARIPLYTSNWSVRAGLRSRRALSRITHQTPLDVLFFHTQVPAYLATNWIRRIPSVVSMDATPLQIDALGTYYAHHPGPAWLENLKSKLQHECFNAARTLVTWSAWAKQSLIDDYGIAADKIVVIPPGVNPSEWTSPGILKEHTTQIKILFVGGDLERKGGQLLLEAFRALRSPGVELHLVTRERRTPEPGLFIHNDIQPNSAELKKLYHEADIFCLPTKADCLPMVLSEAGAAGLPVVSTQMAAIPEIVKDGETGYLVPVDDIEALTAALRRLIDNPELRHKLGQRAIEVVSSEFNARKNAQKLVGLLKQTVDEAGNDKRRSIKTTGYHATNIRE